MLSLPLSINLCAKCVFIEFSWQLTVQPCHPAPRTPLPLPIIACHTHRSINGRKGRLPASFTTAAGNWWKLCAIHWEKSVQGMGRSGCELSWIRQALTTGKVSAVGYSNIEYLSVRMNTYNSDSSQGRVVKFGDNLPNCSTQLKLWLSFG